MEVLQRPKRLFTEEVERNKTILSFSRLFKDGVGFLIFCCLRVQSGWKIVVTHFFLCIIHRWSQHNMFVFCKCLQAKGMMGCIRSCSQCMYRFHHHIPAADLSVLLKGILAAAYSEKTQSVLFCQLMRVFQHVHARILHSESSTSVWCSLN